MYIRQKARPCLSLHVIASGSKAQQKKKKKLILGTEEVAQLRCKDEDLSLGD